MAIYTRTGDAGTTALFTGQRVSKTHPRVEAYGTLDELNAALSLCVCATHSAQHRALLEAIQLQIFWFSAELASESEQPSADQRYISSEEIAALEAAIDTAMGRVAPLHSFILPGRCEAASRLHFARTLARRAERRLVELAAEVTVRHVLMRYINRLSDCLYALARAEDHDAHQDTIIREVTKRYLAAGHAPVKKESTMSLSFGDLHQLTRAAVERAQVLNVPVVISIVDANGTEAVTWRMPDALLVSSELAPKKAAGTAAGFTGLFGYLGGSVAASAIVGYTVDFFGWDGGFMVMIGGSILAVILLIVVMIGEKRHHAEMQLKRNGG